MKKEIITVNGMSCAHCEGRVNAALTNLDGVKSAKASAKNNNCTVKFDENVVAIDKIKNAITQVGYTV